MPSFVHANRTKRAFLQDNSAAFIETIANVNDVLRARYHDETRPVTLVDAWVITYCEAGIHANGTIHPHYRHSNGEIGVYPLPRNIKHWNGGDAPDYDKPHSVDQNTRHYLEHLGHLKNKVVKTIDEVPLYRDLFELGGGQDVDQKNARILAGVVHGYFFEGTYSDGRVPLAHLRAGYDANEPLADIMSGTRYKHAGSSIIPNRSSNIEAALDHMTG